MKKYEELKKAVADGKFNKHINASRISRLFFDKSEAEMLNAELNASLVCDGIVDNDTKDLILKAGVEALAEKLAEDKVFDYSSKFESFDDLLGLLKDIADI